MKKLITIATVTVLFLLTGINTFAQTDTLTAEQAKTMINKEVIVKANVAGTRLFDKDGNKTFLINLDKRYPQSPLTVVLYDKAYKDLNLQYELQEKDIVVKGTVSIYNDRPQIIVSDVKNLKILK
jgi:DNA/RNA endonuclease YhcR with UshA esterase domain